MAENHNFRSAFHGFNRIDVVTYIEYLNNKHNSQINQMRSENQALKDELVAAKASVPEDQLEKIAQLETQVAALTAQLEANGGHADLTGEELEAYRRAERTERAAKERAQQIYRQATATLADATAQVDSAAEQFRFIAETVSQQVSAMQNAVDSGKAAMESAAATLYTICPEGAEE